MPGRWGAMLPKTKYTRPKPDPVPCEVCRLVPVQSGTVCAGCRVRKCRGTTIAGNECAICGVDNPRVLRWHRFTDRMVALCANHSALVGRTRISFVAYEALARAHDLNSWRATA